MEVNKIDKLAPKDVTVNVSETGSKYINISINTEDTEETAEYAKSGMDKYEYYIKEATVSNYRKYESHETNYSFKELSRNTNYNIYVIAYDKAGNKTQSKTINVTTLTGEYAKLTSDGVVEPEELAIDALGKFAYDKNETTDFYLNSSKQIYYLNIDPSCWGKYMTIKALASWKGGLYGFMYFQDKNGKVLSGGGWGNAAYTNLDQLTTVSHIVPEGAVKCKFSMSSYGSRGTGTFNIYELWCSDDDLSEVQTYW